MDKVTAIKIKYDDNTYSNYIPFAISAENVTWNNLYSLEDIIGKNVDVANTGTLQNQIIQLKNDKMDAIALQNYVSNGLITSVSDWLEANITPADGAVAIDKSFSIEDMAADAKLVGDNFYTKADVNQIIVETTGEIKWKIPQGSFRQTSTAPMSLSENRLTVNGEIGGSSSTYSIRAIIYGDQLAGLTANPNYSDSNYQKYYIQSPITAFTPGHRIKAKIKLVSGSYTSTYPPYIEFRNRNVPNTYLLRLQDEDETYYNQNEGIITDYPEFIVLGIRKGTYDNAVFEFNVFDMDATSNIINNIKYKTNFLLNNVFENYVALPGYYLVDNTSSDSNLYPGRIYYSSNADYINPPRLISVPIEGGCTYKIHKSTETVMRVGSFENQTPEGISSGTKLARYAGMSQPSTDSLIITTGENDAYLYIQLYVNTDNSYYKNIISNIDGLTIQKIDKNILEMDNAFIDENSVWED